VDLDFSDCFLGKVDARLMKERYCFPLVISINNNRMASAFRESNYYGGGGK
jgi:hypothetical protein